MKNIFCLKRLRSVLCAFLSCCFIFLAGSAYAYEPEFEKIQVDDEIVSREVIKNVADIPVYVTYISDWNESTDSVKEQANAELKQAIARSVQTMGMVHESHEEASPLMVQNARYTIVEVGNEERSALINRPAFANTFNRAAELVEQGITVNHINFFVPQSFSTTSSFDASDPAAWEAECPALCPAGGSNVYNGYKFLYLESSLSVETTPAEPGNVGTFRWGTLVTKLFKLVCDIKVKNEIYQSISAASGRLSDFYGLYDPPYDVVYSNSRGYLKLWISGDLYTRTILISDNLNRISGYAYYGWGTLERFRGRTKADSKWPTNQLPSGVYEYDTRTYTYPDWNEVKSPGFYGNTTLYTSVINFYKNTLGYFTHVESVDLDSLFSSIL